MEFFFKIVQIIAALLLIVLVLLHSAKSEGISSIGGSAQMFKTASTLERGLNIVTWSIGIIFLLSSALLSWNFLDDSELPKGGRIEAINQEKSPAQSNSPKVDEATQKLVESTSSRIPLSSKTEGTS